MSDETKKLLEAKKKALLNNGLCLSNTFINAREKLEWKCHPDHPSWFALFSILQRKAWCPICGVEKRTKKKK